MNDQLKSIVERIENLEQEKRDRQEDIGEVYKEAKGEGFDVKILRKVVALRRKSKVDREQEEALMETYLKELGEKV
jgi:uncharacterized protein (UPF0335 family)